MYSIVNERVSVLAVFKEGSVFPYMISWQGQRRKIDKVNLKYQEREGGSINYFFAIESKGLIAKLRYNDKSLLWTLEEIWLE
ncbi:MAG: hypothetical protein PHW75_00335 [Patescibacteria group bacterium]|nr:hypothetical protein [Patescibacteria group bacterium]